MADTLPPFDAAFPEDDDSVSHILPSYLRVRDVAQIFSVHPDTMRTWMRDGRLKYISVGGTTRLKQGDVRRFLLKHQDLVGGDEDVATPDVAPRPKDSWVSRLRRVELGLLEARTELQALLNDMRAGPGRGGRGFPGSAGRRAVGHERRVVLWVMLRMALAGRACASSRPGFRGPAGTLTAHFCQVVHEAA